MILGIVKKYAVAILVLAIAYAGAVPARAVTLTFEDMKPACDANLVPSNPYGAIMPYGYGGLSWGNFYALDAPLADAYRGTPSGYGNGMVSGSIVLYNSWENPAGISQTEAPISLHSAYLTGAWNDGLNVRAEGYLDGVLKYTKTVTVSYYQPTLVDYEFINVDTVEWSSWGGTPVSFRDTGTQFVLDNLSYEIVPEPSSILPLVCGIGTLGGFALRRRRS